MVEKPELEDGFKFRSDHRALDLTATVSGRKRNAPSDALKTAADLARWLRAAGLGETRSGRIGLGIGEVACERRSMGWSWPVRKGCRSNKGALPHVERSRRRPSALRFVDRRGCRHHVRLGQAASHRPRARGHCADRE